MHCTTLVRWHDVQPASKGELAIQRGNAGAIHDDAKTSEHVTQRSVVGSMASPTTALRRTLVKFPRGATDDLVA